ncbi:MAG: hypothetical protein A2855_00895 [Candidatus Liptonbacteria bacterium RIFCSPHIGHO2_01_FULL_57_28]|uniref:Uncharacterized protein n=1 Tax=Candidatus Liptonbacteria bacterium RIFCSPHIGHO2_01_FULL_57_28 TaxID=1798647 RepID=A0A1G2CBE3_9BACT|nr:MAG: hypothetical protein A2855_00895 [Candidatus Liptonbacteria bacterium RIFCSPHIGHO2_01_FULL_57_28]
MRHVKQLIYGVFYLILLTAFVGGIYSWAKPVPTCFDGRQNRDETGVDCGGRCAKVCVPAAIASLVQNGEPKLVLLVTSADTGPAAVPRVSVVSEIRNPNQDFGASKFDYVFKIYDPSGAEIASFPDSSYIYPGEIKRIVLLNKTLPAGSSPAAARLILQSPLWVPLERFPRPKLSIQTVNTTEERGNLVVKGTLVNQDSVDFQTVEVTALYYDQGGAVVGVSGTGLGNVSPGESREFSIFHPVIQNAVSERTQVFATALNLR